MTARMFRAPVSIVKNSGFGSVIQDNGAMRNAPPASNGYFLFSEVGAGVKPLCLVGEWDDVLRFLLERKHSGIQNQISDLPEIYMSVEKYRPGPRFVGLFPFHDAIVDLVEKFADFFPGNKATDIIGGIKNIGDGIKGGGYAKTYSSRTSVPSNLVAISWHYLQSKGMEKIGSETITFAAMYGVIDNKLSSLHGT
jgi:hypothetical protein